MSGPTSPTRPAWVGMLREAFVIVASILLAFWIDASWQVRVDRTETRSHLSAIREELLANVAYLEGYQGSCSISMSATRALMAAMGPDPDPLPADSVARLVARSFGRTTGSLRTAAIDAMIADGRFADIDSPELQRLLTEWLAGPVRLREVQTTRREAEVDRTMSYLTTVMPAGHITAMSRIEMPASRFPFDAGSLLADPTLQGYLGAQGVATGHVCEDDERDRLGAALELLRALELVLGLSRSG